tara:strand:- start:242 stop:433 length:192 start_codon:yes stop_codon:yes gene_type:complete
MVSFRVTERTSTEIAGAMAENPGLQLVLTFFSGKLTAIRPGKQFFQVVRHRAHSVGCLPFLGH